MRWGKHPGRVRDRLAELLASKGLIVSPYDLWTQEGFYRSRYHDLARWGSNHARWEGGQTPKGVSYALEVSLCPWDMMSDCVRWGIEISDFDGPFAGWAHVEISHAKGPS